MKHFKIFFLIDWKKVFIPEKKAWVRLPLQEDKAINRKIRDYSNIMPDSLKFVAQQYLCLFISLYHFPHMLH